MTKRRIVVKFAKICTSLDSRDSRNLWQHRITGRINHSGKSKINHFDQQPRLSHIHCHKSFEKTFLRGVITLCVFRTSEIRKFQNRQNLLISTCFGYANKFLFMKLSKNTQTWNRLNYDALSVSFYSNLYIYKYNRWTWTSRLQA